MSDIEAIVVAVIALTSLVWTAISASRAVKALKDLQELARRNLDANREIRRLLQQRGAATPSD